MFIGIKQQKCSLAPLGAVWTRDMSPRWGFSHFPIVCYKHAAPSGTGTAVVREYPYGPHASAFARKGTFAAPFLFVPLVILNTSVRIRKTLTCPLFPHAVLRHTPFDSA